MRVLAARSGSGPRQQIKGCGMQEERSSQDGMILRALLLLLLLYLNLCRRYAP